MIETVRKRFEDKPEQAIKRRKSVVEDAADTLDREVLTGPITPAVEKTLDMAMTGGKVVASGRDTEYATKRK